MLVEYAPVGGRGFTLSGVDGVVAHLARLDLVMVEAMGIVHEHTKRWFDSKGEGTWPSLARGTVVSKTAQGASQPAKPLYRFGNLYESVTSRGGPYSFDGLVTNGIFFGVDWTVRGYQIADVLAMGNLKTGGRIPARPIWPPAHTALGMEMTHTIGQLILRSQFRARAGGTGGFKGGQFLPKGAIPGA